MELPTHFKGIHYRLPDTWKQILPIDEFATRPIKYLEVGVFYGANLLCVADTIASHTDSELHAIDPWIDYEEYAEYKKQQTSTYETCMENINQSNHKSRIHVHRGYSHLVIPTFPDNYFDIVYIDGNHAKEFVLEDVIHAFRKTRSGGYIVFDDYGWAGVQNAVEAFHHTYHEKINVLGVMNDQLFIQKI